MRSVEDDVASQIALFPHPRSESVFLFVLKAHNSRSQVCEVGASAVRVDIQSSGKLAESIVWPRSRCRGVDFRSSQSSGVNFEGRNDFKILKAKRCKAGSTKNLFKDIDANQKPNITATNPVEALGGGTFVVDFNLAKVNLSPITSGSNFGTGSAELEIVFRKTEKGKNTSLSKYDIKKTLKLSCSK